jgi:hypothetical protein
LSPRYGSFTLRTDCKHCGQPIPVNGPVQRVHCAHCQRDVDLPDAIWPHLLGHFDEVHDTLADGAGDAKSRDVLGFPVHYEYARTLPRCEKCSAPFPAERLEPGTSRDFWCVSCGDPASAYPAPEWLRGVVPNATEIYSTEPGAGPAAARGVVAEAREDAPKPVVMTCPQCGGALKITAETERTTTCHFCRTDVYLPDDLWRRLHPAKVVRAFYVRFDGTTETQRQAARQAEREQRARNEGIRRAAQAEEDAREKDEEILRLKQAAYVWVQVLYVMMVLTLASIALSLRTSVLGDAEAAVCIALVAVTTVVVLVAVAMASRPVKRRTGYDGAAMMFVAWFYLIFGFLMPVVGQLMVLVMGFKRFAGTLGGVTISSGEGTAGTYYPAITLTQGETYPLGFVYVAFALWWPAAIAGVVSVASPGALGF